MSQKTARNLRKALKKSGIDVSKKTYTRDPKTGAIVCNSDRAVGKRAKKIANKLRREKKLPPIKVKPKCKPGADLPEHSNPEETSAVEGKH